MTVIRPNSISGITSITAQANEINLFRSNGTLAGLQLNGVNFNTTTGVSTFNNLDVGGVLTYQDVTNVDSVGIITARSTIDAQGAINLADSIIHTGDTNTKIRFPANDTISFETSGTEKVRIQPNGRVGIGTDNPPDCTLTVCEFNSGTEIYDNIALRLQGSTGQNVALQFTDTTGAAAYIAVQGDALRLGTNNAEKLRITSAGKVGIGSEIPAATFDVAGGGQFKTNGASVKIESSTGTNFTQLQLVNTGGNFYVGRENNAGNWFSSGTGYASVLRSDGAYPLIFRVNSANRLTIDSDGRCIVGGGTHAGGSALVVKGGNQNTYSTIGMFSNHTNPAADTLLSQIRFGSNATAVGADIRVYADAAWGTNDYPTRLSFYTTPDSSNSRQERLRITSDGFIGINDTAPYNGLTINKEGDYFDTNGNTYAHPEGRVLSTWRGDRNDNTDYWVGFVGKYMKPSATVNILLQPHVGNFNNQAGMYIAGEATGNYSSDFTLGKIMSGDTAGRGTTASSGKRATKSELFRVANSGHVKFDSGFGSVSTAYGCRAWIQLSQSGSQSITGSGGVSSLTDQGTGMTKISFSTAMPDDNYAMVGGAQQSGASSLNYGFSLCMQTYTTTYAIFIYRPSASSDTKEDNSKIHVAFFR